MGFVQDGPLMDVNVENIHVKFTGTKSNDLFFFLSVINH